MTNFKDVPNIFNIFILQINECNLTDFSNCHAMYLTYTWNNILLRNILILNIALHKVSLGQRSLKYYTINKSKY